MSLPFIVHTAVYFNNTVGTSTIRNLRKSQHFQMCFKLFEIFTHHRKGLN